MTFEPLPLPAWLESVQSTQSWIVPELVQSDGIVLIDGPRKRGKKTFWANTLALCVASGRPLPVEVEAPQKVVHLPVLYLEEEGTRAATKDRWLKQLHGLGLEAKDVGDLFYSHRAGVRLDSPDWPERVVQFCSQEGVGLVIIDAFNYTFAGDENKSSDVKLPLEAIRGIRATGPTVMMVHHVGKSGPVTGKEREMDIDDRSRGSTAIVDAYDNHHAMVIEPHCPFVTMHVRHRDGGEGRWELYWTFEDHRIYLKMRRYMAAVEELGR